MITIKKYGLKIYNWEKDKIPLDAVSVDRPSTYANPFSYIGKYDGQKNAKAQKEVFELYKKYVQVNVLIKKLAVRNLKGKNLVCSCAKSPCHAEILMDLANA